MSVTITVGGFKGGVGKTSATCMIGYALSKDYKVLIVDFDPQANATGFLTSTYKDVDLGDNFISLYEAMENDNLKNAIKPLSEGLDFIPNAKDLSKFTDFVNRIVGSYEEKRARDFILKMYLDEVKNDYDFILIDTPPAIYEFTSNALLASDYALIIMQTETDSFLGALHYYDFVLKMNEEIKQHNKEIEALPNNGKPPKVEEVQVLGVLPYLQTKKSKIDDFILSQASSQDEENIIRNHIFQSRVYRRERIKRYRLEGILNQDHHDKEAQGMYERVKDEILEKVMLDE